MLPNEPIHPQRGGFDWLTGIVQYVDGYVFRNSSDPLLKNLWLFNMEEDPSETTDLAASFPDIVNEMLSRLAKYNATAVPPNFPPFDVASDPALRGGYLGPWVG